MPFVFNIPLAFAIVVASLLIIHITIKMKYGFWYYQPVVKTYQFWTSLSPSVIVPELPTVPASHYLVLNPAVIATKYIDTLNATQQTDFIALVNAYYLRSKNGNIYSPASENILPYFNGHDMPCFISFYYKDIATQIVTNNVAISPTIIGAITGRPLLVTYNDNNVTLVVYYIDFLCVNRNYRRKGIAAQLIQTHEYWQRQRNRQVAVCLFKHETDVLQGVVPLVSYTTYGFNGADILEAAKGMAIVAPPYKMGTIKTNNMPDLYAFIQECRGQRERWGIFISTSIANIMALMGTANIYIHVITDMDTKNIVAAYFYKNTCVSWDNAGAKVLMLEGSLSLLAPDSPQFIAGFFASYRAISKKHGFTVCGIECIADNVIIYNFINASTHITPIIQTPTAYFFYNFKHPTVNANNAFILH